MMKIYDKAQWHIDAGENESVVLARFSTVFSFLNNHNLLSAEGAEIYDLGVDDSISLHERLLTVEGNKIMTLYYDHIISLEPSAIVSTLNKLINEM